MLNLQPSKAGMFDSNPFYGPADYLDLYHYNKLIANLMGNGRTINIRDIAVEKRFAEYELLGLPYLIAVNNLGQPVNHQEFVDGILFIKGRHKYTHMPWIQQGITQFGEGALLPSPHEPCERFLEELVTNYPNYLTLQKAAQRLIEERKKTYLSGPPSEAIGAMLGPSTTTVPTTFSDVYTQFGDLKPLESIIAKYISSLEYPILLRFDKDRFSIKLKEYAQKIGIMDMGDKLYRTVVNNNLIASLGYNFSLGANSRLQSLLMLYTINSKEGNTQDYFFLSYNTNSPGGTPLKLVIKRERGNDASSITFDGNGNIIFEGLNLMDIKDGHPQDSTGILGELRRLVAGKKPNFEGQIQAIATQMKPREPFNQDSILTLDQLFS